MRRWLAFFTIVGIIGIAVLVLVSVRFFSRSEARERYAGIRAGMTAQEVEVVMGRQSNHDLPADASPSGRRWQQWIFPGVVLNTEVEVQYGRDGRLVQKAICKYHPRFAYSSLIDVQSVPSAEEEPK